MTPTAVAYKLRWEDNAVDEITIRWDSELDKWLEHLRGLKEASEASEYFGEWLRRLLAPTRWPRRSLVLEQPGVHALEINSAANELYVLPWELLRIGETKVHVAEKSNVRLHYTRPDAALTSPDASARAEGGRIVLAWSTAGGQVGPGQFSEEIEAARAGDVGFKPKVEVVADASLASLVDALERASADVGERPAILHILCHGVLENRTFGLALGTRGSPNVVDAAGIRALEKFADRIRLVVLMACDGANAGELGSLIGSVAATLHDVGFEAVIASRAPISGPAALSFTKHFYGALLEKLFDVGAAFTYARQRQRLEGGEAGVDWAKFRLYAHRIDGRPIVFRPYRGLLAFECTQARFFCGRGEECEQALTKLAVLATAKKPRLLVITGASGSGKSSVALAGVIPRLAAEAKVMRPGADPTGALEQVLKGGARVVVVDQFEELFVRSDAVDPAGKPLYSDARDAATKFAKALWELACDPVGGVSVVLTLRIDYLGRCGDLPLAKDTNLEHIAYDEAHRVLVARMTGENLCVSIDKPAAVVGLTLAGDLRDRLLREIGDEASALPLLQVALDELWLRRRGDVLAYETLGTVSSILAERADSVLKNMSDSTRAAARRLLVGMASFGGSRATGVRVQLVEAEARPTRVESAGAWDQAVRELVDARLLVRSERDGAVFLDISHETLIRGWRQLWIWYQEDRVRVAEQRQLGVWLQEWRTDTTALLTGNKLGFALRLRELYREELLPDALELVAASEAAEQKQRRQARLRARITLAASVVFLVLMVFAAISWRAASQAGDAATAAMLLAEANERAANRSLAASEARRLAGLAADAQREGEPERALLLAAEAASAEARLGRDLQVAEVSRTLRDLLASHPEHEDVLSYKTELRPTLAWSPDGRFLAVGTDSVVRIAQPGVGMAAQEREVPGNNSIVGVTFTGDSTRFLVATSRREVFMWHIDRDEPIWKYECTDCQKRGSAIALHPDGSIIAVHHGLDAGVHLVWSESSKRVHLPVADESPIDELQWSASGALMACTETAALIWPTHTTPNPVVVRPATEKAKVLRAAISGDGGTVALVTEEQTELWQIDPGSEPRFRERVLMKGYEVRLTRDGMRLFVKGQHPIVLDPKKRSGPLLTAASVSTGEFHPDGRTLVTLEEDAAVRVYEGPERDAGDHIKLPRPFRVLKFNPSGTALAVAGDNGAQVWRFPFAREPRLVGPVRRNAEDRAVAWADGGAKVVRVTHELTVQRTTLEGVQLRGTPLLPPETDVQMPSISGDGQMLAYFDRGTHESVLVSLDGSGRRVVMVAGIEGGLYTWSADSSRLLIGGHNRLWVADRQGGARQLAGTASGIIVEAISKDGSRIAAALQNHSILVWEDGDPTPKQTIPCDDSVARLEFNRSATQLLAMSSKQGTIFPVANEPSIAMGGWIGARWAGFSPDGTRLAVIYGSGAVQIKSLVGGAPILAGTVEGMAEAAWSPDCTRLAIMDTEGVLTICRADGSGEPAVISRTLDEHSSLSWSPDSRHILLHGTRPDAPRTRGTGNGARAEVVTVATADLRAMACKLAKHELKPGEWAKAFPDRLQVPTCGEE